MSTATALFMQEDIDRILDNYPDLPQGKKQVHVYEAQDGTALTVELTRYEAYLLEREWSDEDTALANFHRLDD